MKRTVIMIMAWLCAIVGFCQTVVSDSVSGGTNVPIAFSVNVPSEGMTAPLQALLKGKLEAAIAHSDMGGSNSSEYVIVPTIIVARAATAENSISPTTVISGELTLLAKNRYSGKAYNELTIPLRATKPITSKADNIELLIESINTHDKRIVRFLKVAKKRILQ